MIPWWQLEFAALVLERSKVSSITIRELISASGLSRQTVQRYLKDFEMAGLLVRSRIVEGRGRPKHRYKPTLKLARAVSTGLGGELDKVLISFKILRRACKWCKGGFCKKKVKQCTSTICPIIKASKEIM
ncbi:MAG: helix-turn-helix domain-containing protein [Candidatus Bathyarchaeota archaeon]|nr:helix-turn-helix domain-containing protein [Candidatus Bathyarchaeota archaeon]